MKQTLTLLQWVKTSSLTMTKSQTEICTTAAAAVGHKKEVQLKGIGRRYGLRLIWMSSFLLVREKVGRLTSRPYTKIQLRTQAHVTG